MQKGFEQDRFQGTASEEFLCQIDYMVAKGPNDLPYTCSVCQNIFCRECIQEWQKKYEHKKNECLQRCKNNVVKAISGDRRKNYLNLQIKCFYCKNYVRLGDLTVHEVKCQIPAQERCLNFDICGKRALSNGYCGKACLLINALKAAGQSKKEMFECIKNVVSANFSNLSGAQKTGHTPNQSIQNYSAQIQLKQQMFMEETVLQQTNLMNQMQLQSQAKQPQAVNSYLLFEPINQPVYSDFSFSPIRIGQNIQLTNLNMTATLNEAAYVFKTAIVDKPFQEGLHYWEVKLHPMTENEMKIGISITNNINFNTAFCDTNTGFAYYGLGQLRNGNNSQGAAYGDKYKKEGTIGIFLNMKKGQLSFSLNGKNLGVAFNNSLLTKGPIYPAVAMLHVASCTISSELPVPSHFKQ